MLIKSHWPVLVTYVCWHYEKYKANNEDPLRFEIWCKQRLELPQFKYWSMVIDLQCLILIFVRPVRESDFNLYKASLNELCKLFSRWNKLC